MVEMPGTATAATVIVFDAFRNRFDFSLLAVSPAKFQPAHLKGAQAIAKLDDVY